MANLINGTWDFKWPQGTKIRVAFQELPDSDVPLMPKLRDIIARYTEIASRWLQQAPKIKFDFMSEGPYAPRPVPKSAEGLLDLRSPRIDAPLPYDVLVSFASTPGKVTGGANPADDTTITGQLSVLGSYARRINHGSPTTIVGPNRDEIPDNKMLGDYFDDPYFNEIVLHEVGHVLGMAHTQQDPLYPNKPTVKSNAAITAELVKIRQKYWTKFDARIDGEIRRPWPGLPVVNGKVPYSDWLELPDSRVPLEEFSVMTHPIWSDLVDGSFDKHYVNPHKEPTEWDFKVLAEMYPPV